MGTAWFVDAAYLWDNWKHLRPGTKPNYPALRARIEADAGEKVGDAYYFDSESKTDKPSQDSFYTVLKMPPPRGAGLRLKLYWLQETELKWPRHMGGKPVVHPETGEIYKQKRQKAVDVGLALHLMRSYQRMHWDKLYLVAGDGDFHEVVQHFVETEDVEVTVMGWRGTISSEILPFVRPIYFDDIGDSITYEDNGPSGFE